MTKLGYDDGEDHFQIDENLSAAGASTITQLMSKFNDCKTAYSAATQKASTQTIMMYFLFIALVLVLVFRKSLP